jgi:hypothetical protein
MSDNMQTNGLMSSRALYVSQAVKGVAKSMEGQLGRPLKPAHIQKGWRDTLENCNALYPSKQLSSSLKMLHDGDVDDAKLNEILIHLDVYKTFLG